MNNFKNEVLYQTTMSLVRIMLKNKQIEPEEYRRIDKIFIEKYKPIIGSLFSDITLT